MEIQNTGENVRGMHVKIDTVVEKDEIEKKKMERIT